MLAGLLAWREAATAWPSGPRTEPQELRATVARLASELHQLREEREMPARIVDRGSASICYIYGEYTFSRDSMLATAMRVRVSGTGFVVRDGWVATNRHVAEPWFGDPHAELFRAHGGVFHLQRLLAFFPGRMEPVPLSQVAVSGDADLAIAHLASASDGDDSFSPPALALAAGNAAHAGDAVLVLGYPMGIEGMLAKSPRPVAKRLALEENDYAAARQLAALALIRPSATQGHIGDVVGDKLLYDAGTAQGASGAPVFNAKGEVIGVNSAYLDGFTGGTLGVSVEKLRELLAKSTHK